MDVWHEYRQMDNGEIMPDPPMTDEQGERYDRGVMDALGAYRTIGASWWEEVGREITPERHGCLRRD